MNARVFFTLAYTDNSAMLAFADVIFDGGFLDGLKMTGITIWRAKEGGVTVLLPSRQQGTGTVGLLIASDTGGEQFVVNFKNHVAMQYAAIAGSHILPWTCFSCGGVNGPPEGSCTECGAEKVVGEGVPS